MLEYTDNELLSILEEIDSMNVNLTDWESGFIENVFNNGINTERQRQVIYKLMEKYQGGSV